MPRALNSRGGPGMMIGIARDVRAPPLGADACRIAAIADVALAVRLSHPLAVGDSTVFDRIVFLILPAVALLCVTRAVPADEPAKKPASVLDFQVKDIDGKDVDLSKYKGEVLLIVNTASQCGYTPQYEGLEAIYEKYKGQGFEVLAFPANEFGQQEPGTDAEIKSFCSSKYNVTFPLFSKIVVKGEGHPPALPVPDQPGDRPQVRRRRSPGTSPSSWSTARAK